MKQNDDKRVASSRGYFTKRLLINMSVVVVVGFGLVWAALVWLDVWTEHGKEATVPGVLGMDYAEATRRLAADGFAVELNDSLYDSSRKPGAVVDQNPRKGTKVKPGREIYLTINSLSPRTVKVPQIVDVSERQAKALLNGVGLKNITVVKVPSDYKGLVVGARSGGRMIVAGMRLPVSASIVLEVGEGPAEFSNDEAADSLTQAVEGDGFDIDI